MNEEKKTYCPICETVTAVAVATPSEDFQLLKHQRFTCESCSRAFDIRFVSRHSDDKHIRDEDGTLG